MADADSLAHAILELKNDANLRSRIAEAGYETFMNFGAIDVLAKELRELFLVLWW